MGPVPSGLEFLLMIFAGWVNRQQFVAIDFLKAENRMLKYRVRGKRICFTGPSELCWPGRARAVGRKALLELDTLVSSDTLLRWHRQLVAQKWNFNHQGLGNHRMLWPKEDSRDRGP